MQNSRISNQFKIRNYEVSVLKDTNIIHNMNIIRRNQIAEMSRESYIESKDIFPAESLSLSQTSPENNKTTINNSTSSTLNSIVKPTNVTVINSIEDNHIKKITKTTNNSNGTVSHFQQIGSQRINIKSTDVAHNSSNLNFDNNNDKNNNNNNTEIQKPKSTVRISAKKVDPKNSQPKLQRPDSPMLNHIFDTFSSANKHHHHDLRYGPHFEDLQETGQPYNLTVQAGSSIHLNCKISLLQDKMVSWVRRNAQSENALDLLTVGLNTYTGDKRYKMEFQYPNNWRLKIINVKKDDEAAYECQISTHPPRVYQINLHVNAPIVMIVDEFGDPLQEKYYEIDSTLQLSCNVRNVAMSTSVVYWQHGEYTLNYDVTRGGISLKTELMEDGANSTLSIAKIKKSDSGNYTCSISEFQNYTIMVHILNGESFAELHHGSAGDIRLCYYKTILNIAILFILYSGHMMTHYINR